MMKTNKKRAAFIRNADESWNCLNPAYILVIVRRSEPGIVTMGIRNFLPDENSLNVQAG